MCLLLAINHVDRTFVRDGTCQLLHLELKWVIQRLTQRSQAKASRFDRGSCLLSSRFYQLSHRTDLCHRKVTRSGAQKELDTQPAATCTGTYVLR